MPRVHQLGRAGRGVRGRRAGGSVDSGAGEAARPEARGRGGGEVRGLSAQPRPAS